MNQGIKLLSNTVVYSKYAKYIPELKRRETWQEIIERYITMMYNKYATEGDKNYVKENKTHFLDIDIDGFSDLTQDILINSKYLYEKKVLPSMRAIQFAGAAIEKNEARLYNCGYMPMSDYRAFSELMFLLLGGTGVGYSVQQHHIEHLPEIQIPLKEAKFLIGDSIEGWADAVKQLMKSYFGKTKVKPRFDYSDIREKGARLVTAGGKAPGPGPLKICLTKIENLLNTKRTGEKLTSFEVHRINCLIADAVLAGGIRRAALIALFSFEDKEMATCKYGQWWESYPELGRANNSAVILRNRVKKEEFDNLWQMVVDSNSGEPGIYFTNDPEYGTNPCCFGYGTKILTAAGYKQIGDLEGENLDFINKNGEVVPGTVFKSGNKATYTLKLSNKETIVTTIDHRFMLTDGSEKEAQHITRADRLMPFYKLNGKYNEFVKYGFIQGDAATGRLASDKHLGLEVYIGEKDQEIGDIFRVPIGKQYLGGYNEILKELGFDSSSLPDRKLPSTFKYWEKENKLMFFKGLWSANGCVIKNNRIAFKTTSKRLVDELMNELSHLGIESYFTINKPKKVKFSNGTYLCKESYDLNISRYQSVLNFAEHIGFVHTYKQCALEELILQKGPIVLSAKITEVQDVYDFSLFDNTHWGVVQGVVAHNCEISLRPHTFCNLAEVNVGIDYREIAKEYIHPDDLCEAEIKDVSQYFFEESCRVAAFFSTLQAGFTDFHYLRNVWKINTEKDALIGVGQTGIANGSILEYDLGKGVEVVLKENKRVASIIGINKAARVTTIKPSGTTSCVVGTSSGIHSWHSKFYIRNMQCQVGDDLYNFFTENHPKLIKIMDYDPHSAVIGIPQKAPDTAILREKETALDLLLRVNKFNLEWVAPGHRRGPNTNNVSATISCKQNEWEEVGEWMWNNKHTFNGLSVLPFDGGTYKDAPFTECTEEKYNELMSYIEENPVDLTKIIEEFDNTDLKGEVACAGGACEVI